MCVSSLIHVRLHFNFFFFCDFVKAENVYSEVLFSIVHAISFIDFPCGADDVLVYLRSSFQVSEERHQELLDGINQRSVCKFCFFFKIN